MERSSGVLLHVTSLPNRYGLGTISIEAYDFVRWLSEAKVKYWQVLPYNHTNYGSCPYNAYSVYAGNIYWIDLREFLSEEELAKFGIVPKSSNKIDLADMQEKLYNAYWYFYDKCRESFNIEKFKKENSHWIYDYARFMSIKQVYGNKPWWEFPDGLSNNEASAKKRFDKEYGKVIDFYVFLQYIFFMQWTRLKDYANNLGVKIIGDIAIYSAMDGADVWANRHLYQFNEDGNPTNVSGAPPDAFSADGQVWNNPLYDYKEMAKDNYTWWLNRLKITGKLFDMIRLDHFRGFVAYWSVPYGDKNALKGKWEPGPSKKLLKLFKEKTNVEIFAEDLGIITKDVIDVMVSLKIPGMRVFQFGFESDFNKGYLPHNHVKNCVVYLGTHDNNTTKGHFETMEEGKLNAFKEYLGVKSDNFDEMVDRSIRALMGSVADLCVVSTQDLLRQGSEYRMNVPGLDDDNINWKYQLSEPLSKELGDYLKDMITIYERD